MKHTPTPWEWIEGDPDIFTIWNNKEVPLANVKSPVWHEDRLCGNLEAAANAAHIVKCVNMHDELVATLRPFAKAADGRKSKGVNGMHCFGQDLLIAAREALKKAGEL